MAGFSALLTELRIVEQAEVQWLNLLASDLQLIADLSMCDLVLWAPDETVGWRAVAQARPSSATTLFYRDFIGQGIRSEWREQVDASFDQLEILDSSAPSWVDELPTRLRSVPVVHRARSGERRALAVLTRHAPLQEARRRGRQEEAFVESSEALLQMTASGDFPQIDAPPAPRRGAPRASDGLLRLDADGIVTFASPNSLSAFGRLGFSGELEGELLAEVASAVLVGEHRVDEALPLVMTGKAPWRSDIEVRGITVSFRAIPVHAKGERTGAIILSRDVTQVRHQERELMTKDATIREIHHRVKNNLQMVASLLRIQARRSKTEEVRESLQQAMRRVSSIALVHDTLANGLRQDVNFDTMFERLLGLMVDVASSGAQAVHPERTGSFGELSSEVATPLALVLTELVTNAVEHGLAETDGQLSVDAQRTEAGLEVVVRDTGVGVEPDSIGSGIGTQIIRTLVESELSGTIEWQRNEPHGTRAIVHVPARRLEWSPEDDEADLPGLPGTALD